MSTNCGCGNDHESHGSCGCGDHSNGCGCGGHTGGCGCGGHEESTPFYTYHQEPLSDAQKTFLTQLAQCCYLPVVRYVVKSSKEADFQMGAFAPAFIQGDHHSMAELRQVSTFLTELEHLGLLSLDYDIPLEGYDYAPYYESEVFTMLKETVAQGQGREGFWGDTAAIEAGSMALTEAAMDALGNWL